MNELITGNRPLVSHPAVWRGTILVHVRRLLPGLLVSAALAVLAMRLAAIDWLQSHGIGALTAAIVRGIAVGNTLYPRIAATTGAGVTFSKQTLLRAGVILYGLRLTLRDVGQVGIAGVLIDALVLTSTFAIAFMLGTRVFRLDRGTSILIGAGSAICGAAAVMATEPVVRARADQVTVAISTVVVFGTAAMFLYPAIYALNSHGLGLPVGARAFGVYAGSTIHEVAQVFAAGRSVSEDVANTAVITKMVRVTMLAPFLIGLSAWVVRDHERRLPAQIGARVTIPWFAIGFVSVVFFNSLSFLPRSMVSAVITLDTFLLAMAMAALGLTTHVSAIRAAGPKPLVLGGLLFAWLIVGGGAINVLVAGWLN